MEKLITKAKKGDLTPIVVKLLTSLQTVGSAHKLVDEIAPKLKNRISGHLRVKKTNIRQGDNAQMARISFVDDIHPVETSTESTSENITDSKPKEIAK